MKQLITNSAEETMLFGQRFVDQLPLGTTITLTGDLGAGKTTFVRGLARGLGITEVVQSPTFNIMKIYFKGQHPLIHIDAYRLENVNSDIGLDEYIGYETGITVIEWPQYIAKLIPSNCLQIEIKNLGDDKRSFTFSGDEQLLKGLVL